LNKQQLASGCECFNVVALIIRVEVVPCGGENNASDRKRKCEAVSPKRSKKELSVSHTNEIIL
jgi:hypothetical protein